MTPTQPSPPPNAATTIQIEPRTQSSNESMAMSPADLAEVLRANNIESPITSYDLMMNDFELNYLVEGVLVEGQIAIIAGPPKVMKTSIALDLALSLATGEKFLNHFEVHSTKKVLFMSAESGPATIKDTAARVAESKGINAAKASVMWTFWIPTAQSEGRLEVLEQIIRSEGIEVVVVDPLYKCLNGSEQSSLSLMGTQIAAITDRIEAAGATPILVDHTKRSAQNNQPHKPLELRDITGAGKAEIARQWLLVNRRRPYNPGVPIHDLVITAGGSAGHSGRYALTINETPQIEFDPETSQSGLESTQRDWNVKIEDYAGIKASDVGRRRADANRERREVAKDKHYADVIRAITDCLSENVGPINLARVRERTTLNAIDAKVVLDGMVDDGKLERGGTNNRTLYKPVGDWPGIAETKRP